MPVIDTEGKWKYNSNPFATSALEGVAWSALWPGLLPPEKDSVSILQDAGWSLGPFARKNLSQQDSIPDRPAHSESLYGMCFPGRKVMYIKFKSQWHIEYFRTYFDSLLSTALKISNVLKNIIEPWDMCRLYFETRILSIKLPNLTKRWTE